MKLLFNKYVFFNGVVCGILATIAYAVWGYGAWGLVIATSSISYFTGYLEARAYYTDTGS